MKLQVRHLRQVEAIHAAGSITQAAAALGLSQPALSGQLHRIEQLAGRPIFTRGRHGTTPTSFGEAVVAHAREVLVTLDEMNHAIREYHNGLTIRVGTYDLALAGRLGDAIATAIPERAAELVVEPRWSSLVNAVRSGEIDLALTADCPGYEYTPDGFDIAVVGHEPLFVFASRATTGEIALDDLDGATWVQTLDADEPYLRYLADTCTRAGLSSPAVFTVSRLVMAEMIRRGENLAIPLQAVDNGQRAPGPAVSLRGNPLRLRHVLLWTDAAVGEHVGVVCDALRAHYRQLAQHSPRIPGWFDRNPGWIGS
ncbi:LysR family transcriptional regulator [Lentzea sp. JNUCC 0626]|uniref:LysR family transcriptional regulator n=1 Tax=Lentzea sp. JNUCC 0626 TaxID=3367513 RepID=UPI0037480CD6